MDRELLKRAVALSDGLNDRWCPEKANELESMWLDLKKPFAHLYGGRQIGDSVGPGWWPILIQAFTKVDTLMQAHPGFKFNTVQIKEKFGGLRFYFNITHVNDTVDEDGERVPANIKASESIYNQAREFIREAEDRASATCEDCGEPGTLRTGGWLRNQCDAHHRASQERNRKRGY